MSDAWVVVVFGTVVLSTLAILLGIVLRRHLGESPAREDMRAASYGLSMADRYRVLRAVSRGRAVRDPRLARAAVARARFSRHYSRRIQSGRMLKFVMIAAAIYLLWGIFRLVTADGVLDYVVGVCLTVGPALQLTLPWQHRFYQRRFDRAERLNAALLR